MTDFISEFSRPNPYRGRILILSALMTFCLLFLFTREGAKGPPPPPEVTYITSFAPGRSDAEILASNIQNQHRNDALRQIVAEREERKRALYRSLGKISGMDIEEIERQAAIERIAEQEEAKRIREMMIGPIKDIPADVQRKAEQILQEAEETEEAENPVGEPAAKPAAHNGTSGPAQ